MIRIVCVGNLKEKYLKDAEAEYLKRISKYNKVEIIEIKESTNKNISLQLKEEALEINKHLKGYTIKLAILGEQLDSVNFANKINQITLNGYSDITFIIGSSNGLDESIKTNYDLSFSKMTFTHQMSRIILLEQIYRAYSILNNTKYHK